MTFNAFLKFSPDVIGEATQANFEDQIEICSFSWAGVQPSNVGSGLSGTASGVFGLGNSVVQGVGSYPGWGGWGGVVTGVGQSNSAAGKVSISSFNVTKKTDISSCALFSAMCSKQVYRDVVVTLLKATGTSGEQAPFLTFTFSNASLETFQWSGGTGTDDSPIESISIVFTKYSIEYAKQDTELGSMTPAANASWDLIKMSK